MTTAITEARAAISTGPGKPLLRGVHHLALVTADMRATLDFYVRVLGMPLVHALRTPSPPPGAAPAHGLGSPPHKNILHYFLDMGGDSLLAFFEYPEGSQRPTATRWVRCSTSRSSVDRGDTARCRRGSKQTACRSSRARC